MKKALITGITGQDDASLAELLLVKGYEVHGIKRRSSFFNANRIDHLYQDPHKKKICFKLHYGDLTDSMNLTRIIKEIQLDYQFRNKKNRSKSSPVLLSPYRSEFINR